MLIHLQERMALVSPIVIVGEESQPVHSLTGLFHKEYSPLPGLVTATSHPAAAPLSRERLALQGRQGPDKERKEGRLAPAAVVRLVDDWSLSSETPLPPPFPRALEILEEDRNSAEFLEISDEEIELIDSPDEHPYLALARSASDAALDLALTTSNVNAKLSRLESIEGFIGATLTDSDSGMCVGYLGGSGIFDLKIAAAANTEVVRSNRQAMKALGVQDDIEDIQITLGNQYHLMRTVGSRTNLFFYLVLDRQCANLALARFALADVERALPI